MFQNLGSGYSETTVKVTNPTGPAVIGITASSIGNQYYAVLYITGADSHRSLVLISNTGARATRGRRVSLQVSRTGQPDGNAGQ